MRLLPIVLACALASSAQAQTQKRSSIYVIDGDTITINDIDIRLWGIDAPELNQTCHNEMQAGRVARAFLMHLIDNKPLRCRHKDRDRHGRPVMICLNHEGTDLGRAMVSAGWAWAYTQYSLDYAQYEVWAMKDKLGVHGHNCQLPHKWRQDRRTGVPVPLQK